VLCESFANPVILTIFGTNEDDEAVSGSVIRMKEIGDDLEETEATGKYDQEIFGAEEVVEVLLELLGKKCQVSYGEVKK
jgi:hypothetical protein